VDKQDFLFYDAFDLEQVRSEFLTRYYNLPEDIPNSILIDADFADREMVLQLLNERRGSRTFLTVAHTADQNRAVGIARGNALDRLSKAVGRTAHEVQGLEELKNLLGLSKTPTYIESYDISNLGDTGIVAGMVVFENGRPLKSAYRKFSLKEVVTQDDYASMREVLTRRFTRYEEEKESGVGFGRLPDLILLDGGKGHVAAVKPVIQSFGLSVPVYGMVKDSRHRTRAIAADGKEVSVAGYQAAFTLMGRLQEEVHRYAITYQRSKRKQSAFALQLTQVPGIGQKKAEALLHSFPTTAQLKAASAQALAKAAKVNLQKGEELQAFIAEHFK
jgi:excinuclease ABC subunit C